MMRLFLIMWVVLLVLFIWRIAQIPAPPTKTETLTCVRVKQVTPAGTINYLCEVRK